jgi:hypothetical protein
MANSDTTPPCGSGRRVKFSGASTIWGLPLATTVLQRNTLGHEFAARIGNNTRYSDLFKVSYIINITLLDVLGVDVNQFFERIFSAAFTQNKLQAVLPGLSNAFQRRRSWAPSPGRASGRCNVLVRHWRTVHENWPDPAPQGDGQSSVA